MVRHVPDSCCRKQLGVAGDAGAEVGRQAERLVQGVGVERLGVALGGGHGLDAGPHHVVEHVLSGERPARRLAVGTQRKGLVVRRRELPDQLGPQEARSAHLGHLGEEVHADGPEERQAGGEGVDGQPGVEAGPDVLDPVGEGIAQLEVGRGSGLLHVVPGDRDGVEPGHLRGRVGEDVRDDPHRRGGRVDVGVADHELLEHVVLDRARELGRGDALLLGGQDVEGHDGEDGPVHGHRHRHLVEGDTVEELAHVVDGVDGHARHAHVARHPRVVAVVAPVGSQIEGHRQSLLAGCQVAPVEGVGLLRRGEPGVLADGPRLVHVHRGVRAPKEGDNPWVGVEEVEAHQRLGAVEGLEHDALRRLQAQRACRLATLLLGGGAPLGGGGAGPAGASPRAGSSSGTAAKLGIRASAVTARPPCRAHARARRGRRIRRRRARRHRRRATRLPVHLGGWPRRPAPVPTPPRLAAHRRRGRRRPGPTSRGRRATPRFRRPPSGARQRRPERSTSRVTVRAPAVSKRLLA